VIEYITVEGVARHADGLIANNARQGDNGNIRCSTTDIHDHVSDGHFDVDADSHGSRYRFMDHVHLLGAGVLSRVAHSALLDFGDPGWKSNEYPERRHEVSHPILELF